MDLSTWLIENRDRSFKWGEWDCVLFVCEWLKISTGKDHGKRFFKKYSTAAGAYKCLRKHFTVEKLEDAVTEILGSPVPLAFVRAGDIICANLSNQELGVSLGICNGGVSWFLSDDGLMTKPTFDCLRGWHG